MTKYLLNYTPKPTTVSASCWAEIGRFVIEATADVRLSGPSDAQNVVFATAQFVAWQHMGGVRLVREDMFTWDAADSFVSTETKRMTADGRLGVRNMLRRVVETVRGPRDGSPNTAIRYSKSGVRPYRSDEEQAFRVMVSNQRTEHLRQNGEALLALGFGAGLTAAEICTVTGHDIVETEEGVEVHIHGERARVVPVFSEWETALVAAAERAGPRRVFLPNSKNVGRFVTANFVQTLDGKPTDLLAQRMRATWIIRLLDGGVRVNVVLYVAGLVKTLALPRYVVQMAPVPNAEGHASIRALSRPGAEVPA